MKVVQPNTPKHLRKEPGQKHLVNHLKYKKYFRKALLKNKDLGNLFLKEIASKKPKVFLEIGVFQGVTARNVCELLYGIHKENFSYIGIDLFSINSSKADPYTFEIVPGTKQNNFLKMIYFKYILKNNPYSFEAVSHLLKKFKNQIDLKKGDSNKILKTINMSKVDYIFLDGGHSYETVKNDLDSSKEVIKNNGTILCDDYNLHYAPGVTKAIDEFVETNNLKLEFLLNRFAKIEKN